MGSQANSQENYSWINSNLVFLNFFILGALIISSIISLSGPALILFIISMGAKLGVNLHFLNFVSLEMVAVITGLTLSSILASIMTPLWSLGKKLIESMLESLVPAEWPSRSSHSQISLKIPPIATKKIEQLKLKTLSQASFTLSPLDLNAHIQTSHPAALPTVDIPTGTTVITGDNSILANQFNTSLVDSRPLSLENK